MYKNIDIDIDVEDIIEFIESASYKDKKEISIYLKEELSVLDTKPELLTVADELKYDTIMKNFNDFTTEQFEEFIGQNKIK